MTNQIVQTQSKACLVLFGSGGLGSARSQENEPDCDLVGNQAIHETGTLLNLIDSGFCVAVAARCESEVVHLHASLHSCLVRHVVLSLTSQQHRFCATGGQQLAFVLALSQQQPGFHGVGNASAMHNMLVKRVLMCEAMYRLFDVCGRKSTVIWFKLRERKFRNKVLRTSIS
jgi:hypothetical protein